MLSVSDPPSEEIDFDEDQVDPVQDPIEIAPLTVTNQVLLDRLILLSDQLTPLLACVENIKAKQDTVEDRIDSLSQLATKSAWYIRVMQKRLSNPTFTIKTKFMSATFLRGFQEVLLQWLAPLKGFRSVVILAVHVMLTSTQRSNAG